MKAERIVELIQKLCTIFTEIHLRTLFHQFYYSVIVCNRGLKLRQYKKDSTLSKKFNFETGWILPHNIEKIKKAGISNLEFSRLNGVVYTCLRSSDILILLIFILLSLSDCSKVCQLYIRMKRIFDSRPFMYNKIYFFSNSYQCWQLCFFWHLLRSNWSIIRGTAAQ